MTTRRWTISIKARHWAWAVIGLTGALCAAPLPLEMMGSRAVQEKDFDASYNGAFLQVYLRNASSEPVEISTIGLGGVKFNDLPKQAFGKQMKNLNWWMLWPNPVPAGEVAALRVRVDDAAYLGAAPFKLEMFDKAGASQAFPCELKSSPLWIPFIGFSEDLTALTVCLRIS